jgi:hypothetical protein
MDFMLSDRRNTSAAHRFLDKALTTMRHWPPSSVTTDQLGSYLKAISRLKRQGRLAADTKHRTCKYLNNIIEADHGALIGSHPSRDETFPVPPAFDCRLDLNCSARFCHVLGYEPFLGQ